MNPRNVAILMAVILFTALVWHRDEASDDLPAPSTVSVGTDEPVVVKVVDAREGTPVAGARVELAGPGWRPMRRRTAADGAAAFGVLRVAAFTYRFRVTARGFSPVTLDVPGRRLVDVRAVSLALTRLADRVSVHGRLAGRRRLTDEVRLAFEERPRRDRALRQTGARGAVAGSAMTRLDVATLAFDLGGLVRGATLRLEATRLVRAAGGRPAAVERLVEDVVVPDGGDLGLFRFEPADVCGLVVDAGGCPLDAVRVRFRPGRAELDLDLPCVLTGADGWFGFGSGGLPAGVSAGRLDLATRPARIGLPVRAGGRLQVFRP